MPGGSTLVDGQARRALVSNMAVSVTGSGGTSFGVFDAGLYARFAGLGSIIASGTISFQMGANSANPSIVTSTLVVNSGPFTFDVLNYGQHATLGFSQLASQTGARILIYGEPIR